MLPINVVQKSKQKCWNHKSLFGIKDFSVQIIDVTNVNNPTERGSSWIEKLNTYTGYTKKN